MIMLNRVRLINWHFFSDAVIELGQSTLLAGDNGSGKSTIIDAIQYVLVADIRKIQFNAAAAQNRTARTLESYCRCKIGSSSLEYHRDNAITHVILEFVNEHLNSRFCTGIMAEAVKSGDIKELPWIWENASLDEIQIVEGKRLLTFREFRDLQKEKGAVICSTKREYSSRLSHLLKVHRRNVDFNPYFAALVRSVSFTPFTSVDQFVCNYILEERHVDLSAMKENLLNYKEAEGQAYAIKEKIEVLERIKSKQEELHTIHHRILNQQYLKFRITADLDELFIRQMSAEIDKKNKYLQSLMTRHEALLAQKHRNDEISQELTIAYARNETQVLYSRLKRQKEELESKLGSAREEKERFLLLKGQCEAILGRSLDNTLTREKELLDQETDKNREERVTVKQELDSLTTRYRDVLKEKEELQKGILRYPESSSTLRDALEKENISSWIFADLLEIIDPVWQNAVEGWLNTQRFNLLVYERDFQRAIEIYNSLPVKIAGVGLPNLGKMKEHIIEEGTIAEVVHTDSPLALRYVAFLLGDVHMATIKTLKDHRRSITRECMRYSSFTASRIKEEVYSRWYIGKAAKEKRKEELESLARDLEDQIARDRERLQRLDEQKEILSRAYDGIMEMVHLEKSLEEVDLLEAELDTLVNQINEIDTSEFEELKKQIDSIKEQLKKIDGEISFLDQEKGKIGEEINTKTARKAWYEEQKVNHIHQLEEFEKEYAMLLEEFTAYYSGRTKNEAGIEAFNRILANYEPALKGLQTQFENVKNDLRLEKHSYNTRFNDYLPEEGDDSQSFIDTLKRYTDTELPAYIEKIEYARREAEKQFKDHFVSRLNEYILDAKESFNELNYTLKNLHFGQDQYAFTIEEKSEKKKDLAVIKEAADIRDYSDTIFEQLSTTEQKDRVEKLFESILKNDLDSPEVREICDYRQYFHYDIKIQHTRTLDKKTGKPLESYLSRVLREKSGGETQTPYYVAIAASFFRFYKDEEDAIRLVLFDEAFNKMDDERIGKIVEFLNKIGLQVVTAVPTEKIETIAPYMNKINLVLRKDYNAYIRDYRIIKEEIPVS